MSIRKSNFLLEIKECKSIGIVSNEYQSYLLFIRCVNEFTVTNRVVKIGLFVHEITFTIVQKYLISK